MSLVIRSTRPNNLLPTAGSLHAAQGAGGTGVMSEPTIKYQTKSDDPDRILISAVDDDTHIIVLHTDEADTVQQELIRTLRNFELPFGRASHERCR